MAIHAILIGLGFLYMYPFLWVLAGSFKAPGEFFTSGLSLIPNQLNLKNYIYAWNAGHFGTYFTNTLLVTVSVTLLVILFSSMGISSISRGTGGPSSCIRPGA